MRGVRLATGVIVMGIGVPISLFFLLKLSLRGTLIVAATAFMAWCVAEVLATILEKPRLEDRSPTQALREETDRRAEH